MSEVCQMFLTPVWLNWSCPKNYLYIYITCTEENRLPTNKNFIQTQRVSASAFIRGLYIYIYNKLTFKLLFIFAWFCSCF